MKRRHNYVGKFNSLGHFLAVFRLSPDSTPEISAYWNFCKEKRKERGCTAFERYAGLEKHHIVPVSFGGKNACKNYVNLNAYEHMIAHRLFAEAIKSSAKFTKNMVNKLRSTIAGNDVIVRAFLQIANRPLLTYSS